MVPWEIRQVAELGWHVYPMARGSKAGAFRGAAEAATTDLDKIARWCAEYPGAGWRVVCGPSKLFGLDVDRPGPTHCHDGFQALADLARHHGAIPPRPMTRTGGSGGVALFFRHQGEPLRGRSGYPAPGLDPHRGRQALTIPPSRHPLTGKSYTWRVPPWEVEPPPIPLWLAEALRPPADPPARTDAWCPTDDRARAALVRAFGKIQTAASGAANDTLNRQAYHLGSWVGAGMMAEAEAVETLLSAARARKIPTRESLATIRSGLTSGSRKPVRVRHAG